MKNVTFFVLFAFATITYAQTGPGGVGNSSSNLIWLDGNLVTVSTNPDIGTWPDQSGNGNDFSQATTTKQPRIVSYSGFNGVRFEGTDYLSNAGIAALNTNTNSHYVVYNGNASNHVGFLFNAKFTQSNTFLTTYRRNSDIRTWVINSTGGIVDNITPNSSAFQIVSSVWDGGSQTFDSYKNGTSFGSQTGANGNPTGNSANTVGASSNGSYRFNGDMGEVIVYNTVLNSAQRNIVDNYLSSKFAIAISNDLYTYDTTHKYQVIGIGQEADGSNLTAQGKGIVELSVDSLSNGNYVLSGHDNTNLATTSVDIPVSMGSGSREARTWRVGVTGTPGNVTVKFDISSLPLPAGSYYLLVESNNGIFNDGDVVTYGPFADIAGFVTFSGVALADGDYFTIASGTSVGITSVATGYWDIASTWSCNCVPAITDDITISSGHTVTARTAITVNKLTINGVLNSSSTTNFNVKGDYTVNVGGSVTHNIITFNGSVAQNITNTSASTIDFAVLKINNSNNVTLQSGNFSVSNSLAVLSGQLQNVNASFTFLSNATKTAVILSSAGSFSGQFIMQRYISQRNASWGDLSSPVNNHLRDWDSNPAGTAAELLMCGVNGFSGSCGGWNSVYYFDEITQTYPPVTDTSYVLAPGKGIELWLEDTGGILNNKTFDSRGTPNYGNIPVAVADSWNLVGNPYQAWINWNSLTKPTINATYYIWNTNNGSYDAKTNGSIPPHQGFYVESVGAGTLTFTESSKSGSGSSAFTKTISGGQEDVEPYEFVESILKIKNTALNYSHELKLRLNPLAKTGLDYFDASFLPSRIVEAPSITAFSLNSTKPLAINSFDFENEVSIPITIKSGSTGKHVVEAIDIEKLGVYYKNIQLIDYKTNTMYNLNVTKEIEVELSADENDARFELRLNNALTNAASTENSVVNIYRNKEFTVIEFKNLTENYTVSIVNLLGQKVIPDYTNINSTKLFIPNNSIPKGINIITVMDKNNVSIKKINY